MPRLQNQPPLLTPRLLVKYSWHTRQAASIWHQAHKSSCLYLTPGPQVKLPVFDTRPTSQAACIWHQAHKSSCLPQVKLPVSDTSPTSQAACIWHQAHNSCCLESEALSLGLNSWVCETPAGLLVGLVYFHLLESPECVYVRGFSSYQTIYCLGMKKLPHSTLENWIVVRLLPS